MVLAIALFRSGEGGRRRGLVVEEEATSVSHGRIDGHDGGDLPTGPENVLSAAADAAKDTDGGTQVGGAVSLKVKGKKARNAVEFYQGQFSEFKFALCFL